jgi:hypothetical protein
MEFSRIKECFRVPGSCKGIILWMHGGVLLKTFYTIFQSAVDFKNIMQLKKLE